ncbi:MAG: hypothetical protein II937_10025 [Bacteroidales bacterium]|nr:hypothetical protein [Bacteroidales bacterium]
MAEITKVQLEFNKRVLYCMQELKSLNLISSVKDFVLGCGVVYQRYTEMDRAFRQGRSDSRYKTVEIEIVYELVTNYNVSADWLITGRGSMFCGLSK